MIELGELAVAGILSMAIELKIYREKSGTTVTASAIFFSLSHERLAGLFLFDAFWILKNCPEFGNAEDDVSPGEGLLQGLHVVQITLDHLNRFRFPYVCSIGGNVARQTVDPPTGTRKMHVCNRASLQVRCQPSWKLSLE